MASTATRCVLPGRSPTSGAVQAHCRAAAAVEQFQRAAAWLQPEGAGAFQGFDELPLLAHDVWRAGHLGGNHPAEIDTVTVDLHFTANAVTAGISGNAAFAGDFQRRLPAAANPLAAPILDRQGIAVAAFSMSAASSVMTPEAREKYIPLIRQAALKVSAQLGYRPLSSNLQYLAGA